MRRCPRKLITPLTWRTAEHYDHYQAGFLPCKGGAGDQDHKTMSGIKIIAGRVADIRRERREEEERKRNAERKHGR